MPSALRKPLEGQRSFSPEIIDQSWGLGPDSAWSKTRFQGREFLCQAPLTNETGADAYAVWWRAALSGGIPRPVSETSIRALDLFSGAGGLALGVRAAGSFMGTNVTIDAAVDVDQGALEVHRFNHDTRVTVNRSVDLLVDFGLESGATGTSFAYLPVLTDSGLAEAVSGVDLVIAGPPCQGHSSLNNRSRHNDDRNALYLTAPAVAVAVGARAVLIENVPGVVRDRKSVVHTAIGLLESEGYKVSTAVIGAHEVGWGQTRRRFFLLAVKDQPAPSLSEQALALRRAPLNLDALLRGLPDTGSQLLDQLPDYSAQNLMRMQWLVESAARDLPSAIRPPSHQVSTTYSAVYGRLDWSRPAPTMTTGFLTPGRGRFTHPDQPRTLSPREAARIQGFTDSYFDEALLASIGAKRTHLAKWIGDAVPSPLGYVPAMLAIASLLPRS